MAPETQRMAPKLRGATLRRGFGPLLTSPAGGRAGRDQVSVPRRAPGCHFTYLVYQLRAETGARPQALGQGPRTGRPRSAPTRLAGDRVVWAALSPDSSDRVEV